MRYVDMCVELMLRRRIKRKRRMDLFVVNVAAVILSIYFGANVPVCPSRNSRCTGNVSGICLQKVPPVDWEAIDRACEEDEEHEQDTACE